MNKANPTDVADGFIAIIDDHTAYFDRVVTRIAGQPHHLRDTALLAEHTMLASAAALEAMCSDWVVACINRDASAFITHEGTRVEASVRAKFADWHADALTFKPHAHISIADLQQLLDPKKWNLSFRSAADFVAWTDSRLASIYAAKVSALSSDDRLVFDAVKKMRNYIAHGSTSSWTEMNAALLAVGSNAATTGLGRTTYKVNGVGKFLRTAPNGSRRIHLYLAVLRSIGMKLR